MQHLTKDSSIEVEKYLCFLFFFSAEKKFQVERLTKWCNAHNWKHISMKSRWKKSNNKRVFIFFRFYDYLPKPKKTLIYLLIFFFTWREIWGFFFHHVSLNVSWMLRLKSMTGIAHTMREEIHFLFIVQLLYLMPEGRKKKKLSQMLSLFCIADDTILYGWTNIYIILSSSSACSKGMMMTPWHGNFSDSWEMFIFREFFTF